jgi:hypothetical protein
MRLKRPSPAMIVALIALVFAMTGTGIAQGVVRFALNAGKVDGKDAVTAGASSNLAAGKLVATGRLGSLRGKIPIRFLDPLVSQNRVFGRTADVIDNGAETPFTIASASGFGNLTATCSDENAATGNENPRTTISFGNTSGIPMEFARATGSGAVAVQLLAPNQSASFTINTSNTFTLMAQKLGQNVILEGVVRQEGQGTSSARCINYGRVSALAQ